MSLFVLNNYQRHRVHRTDQPSIPTSGDFLSFFTTASTSVLPSNSASLFFLEPDPPGTPSVKGGGPATLAARLRRHVLLLRRIEWPIAGLLLPLDDDFGTIGDTVSD